MLTVATAAWDIFSPNQMTVAAVGLVQFIPDVNRMDKVLWLGSCRDILLYLVQNGMADFAFLGNNLAIWTFMLVIMTAEAAGCVKMAEVAWICAPIYLHFWKEVSAVDVLYLLNCLSYRGRSIFGYFRVA